MRRPGDGCSHHRPGALFVDALLGMRAISAPWLFDRGVYEAWDAAGRVDLARRARDKALELLAEDGGEELPPDVAAELDVILACADRVVTPPAGPG